MGAGAGKTRLWQTRRSLENQLSERILDLPMLGLNNAMRLRCGPEPSPVWGCLNPTCSGWEHGDAASAAVHAANAAVHAAVPGCMPCSQASDTPAAHALSLRLHAGTGWTQVALCSTPGWQVQSPIMPHAHSHATLHAPCSKLCCTLVQAAFLTWLACLQASLRRTAATGSRSACLPGAQTFWHSCRPLQVGCRPMFGSLLMLAPITMHAKSMVAALR